MVSVTRKNVSCAVEMRVVDGRESVALVIGSPGEEVVSFLDAANARAMAARLLEVAAFIDRPATGERGRES